VCSGGKIERQFWESILFRSVREHGLMSVGGRAGERLGEASTRLCTVGHMHLTAGIMFTGMLR
jgi:hypothetical protein